MKSVYMLSGSQQNLTGGGSDTRSYATKNAALNLIRKYIPLPPGTIKFSVKYLGIV